MERAMIVSLDHFVLTVRDIAATIAFYEKLGMKAQHYGEGRVSLHFGRQKINLHPLGGEFEPKAALAMPGTADLCFLIEGSAAQAADRLRAAGVEILLGPVERTGATGRILSVYCRDPDGNLVELSEPLS
jgi:catechol 2,3-dioxygenase-like lactoylglutathione lyase family enzyme